MFLIRSDRPILLLKPETIKRPLRWQNGLVKLQRPSPLTLWRQRNGYSDAPVLNSRTNNNTITNNNNNLTNAPIKAKCLFNRCLINCSYCLIAPWHCCPRWPLFTGSGTRCCCFLWLFPWRPAKCCKTEDPCSVNSQLSCKLKTVEEDITAPTTHTQSGQVLHYKVDVLNKLQLIPWSADCNTVGCWWAFISCQIVPWNN